MKLIFTIFVIVFFIFSQFWALIITPADAQMGELQKLMYVHVPAAWNAMIAFFVVFISSILYLVRKNRFYDHLAAGAAEIGCVLTALALALGSIWGKPTWGVWWTWDARLTSTAVLLFLYLGYLALRKFVEDPDQRARLSAPLGILIFLNVPIVYYSVQWWRTLHQVQSSPATVDENMVLSLRLNAFAFLGIFILWMILRVALSREKAKREEIIK